MRKCSIDKLNELFNGIAQNATLYIPVDDGKGSSYKKFEDGMVMSDALKTDRSVKDLFFPYILSLKLFSLSQAVILNISKCF